MSSDTWLYFVECIDSVVMHEIILFFNYYHKLNYARRLYTTQKCEICKIQGATQETPF